MYIIQDDSLSVPHSHRFPFNNAVDQNVIVGICNYIQLVLECLVEIQTTCFHFFQL